MATTPGAAKPAPAPAVRDEKVKSFDLEVDENNKAKQLKIFSFKRPHMRAFHFAWFSFFLAFFGWFALAPLQGKIKKQNEWLSKGNRFKLQNIIAVTGTIIMRLIIGPVCDRFGPRIAQSTLIGVFSLPLALVGTSRSYWQWTLSRFFIGFIGATFVVTQFWTSIMFSGNIVGTANATSAGWGNLGGGVTQAIMPLVRAGVARIRGVDPDDPTDNTSWRFAVLVPAAVLVLTSFVMFFVTDDLPDGNYADLIKSGKKKSVNGLQTMKRAVTNWRVWILFFLYAGCFGVELIMNGNLANYFSGNDGLEPQFSLNERTAGLIASLFGLMNLFARSIGGIGSDFAAGRYGIRGRLWWFFIVQLTEGCIFLIFSRIRTLAVAIPVLICFSFFVQMAEGATFGIVPFVDPVATGAVSGIVGAGGNFGAVAGGFLLAPKQLNGIADGFFKLSFCVIATAALIPLLHWPHYGSMFRAPSVTEEETK